MQSSRLSLLVVGSILFCCGGLLAQSNPAGTTVTCNFNEEKQLVLEYQPVTINLKKPASTQVPFGRPWAPGGKPITLFTNTPLQVRSTPLAIGAYTMFVIPEDKKWTLIISKSTDMSGNYDQQQDIVRVPMDSGELPTPEPVLSISFAHVASDECNIRIDLDKRGHFAAFQAK